MPCVLETDLVELEAVCRARLAIWLETSPLETPNSDEMTEIFQMESQKLVISHPNKKKIPLIKVLVS